MYSRQINCMFLGIGIKDTGIDKWDLTGSIWMAGTLPARDEPKFSPFHLRANRKLEFPNLFSFIFRTLFSNILYLSFISTNTLDLARLVVKLKQISVIWTHILFQSAHYLKSSSSENSPLIPSSHTHSSPHQPATSPSCDSHSQPQTHKHSNSPRSTPRN